MQSYRVLYLSFSFIPSVILNPYPSSNSFTFLDSSLPPSQQVKYSTMSKVSPLDFQGLVSSFYDHSINDSLDTISCVKCLVKAWLKKLRASTWKRLLHHEMDCAIYFCCVCHQIIKRLKQSYGRSIAASSNFKKRVNNGFLPS